MTSRYRHLANCCDFPAGAQLEQNPPQLRVEAIFPDIFHLIDACAASYNVHINKHQMVRRTLEMNSNIFKDRTEEVWITFQDTGHDCAQSSPMEELAT